MARKFTVKPTLEPLPEGALPAVVFAINDLGEQPRYEGEGQCWQYAVGIEFPSEFDGKGLPRVHWITVAQSFHEKSKLAGLARAAGITVEPGEEFDPTVLIGKNVQAIIEHTDKGEGKVYSNVTSFLKGKGSTYEAKHPADDPMPKWLSDKLAARLDKPVPKPDTTGDWPGK
jgi:hypothetical protein